MGTVRREGGALQFLEFGTRGRSASEGMEGVIPIGKSMGTKWGVRPRVPLGASGAPPAPKLRALATRTGLSGPERVEPARHRRRVSESVAGGPGGTGRGERSREGAPPSRRAKFRSGRCPPALLACKGRKPGARLAPGGEHHPGSGCGTSGRAHQPHARLSGLRAGLRPPSASCGPHCRFTRCGFSPGRDGS